MTWNFVKRAGGGLIPVMAAAQVLFAPVPPAAAGIVVAAPAAGAVLETKSVIVAGSVDAGGRSVTVLVNGRELPSVPLRQGRFSVTLDLAPGRNEVTLKSSGSSRTVEYEFRNPAGAGAYRFHAGYNDGECGECHPKGLHRTEPASSALCHSCHDRKDAFRFLHGPVGAGQCVFCHDPHGSSFGFFLTAEGKGLCVRCHDQPSSRSHVSASAGKSCEECHNPHGADKKFFLHE